MVWYGTAVWYYVTMVAVWYGMVWYGTAVWYYVTMVAVLFGNWGSGYQVLERKDPIRITMV